MGMAMQHERPVAIVLGGGIAHIALVVKLKQRGYHVVIVDYYEHPPAKPYADEHVRESALDEGMVLDIARARKAALVLCLCLDQPLVLASTVSEALGLPVLLDAGTARSVTDKSLMKRAMRDHGIPTSRFVVATADAPVQLEDLSFPVMVKPADGTGSQGVRRADSREQVELLVQEARRFGRSGRVLVEEWCQGEELNVHCLVVSGELKILGVARKRHVFVDDVQASVFIGSIAHADVRRSAGLDELVRSIVKVFGLRNGPLLVQVFHRNGEWSVIELAARIGGGMGQHLVELLSGRDIISSSIDLYLGRAPSVPGTPTKPLVYGTIILYARSGAFASITGVERMEQEGLVLSSHRYLAHGAIVPHGLSSKNRVGALIVAAENEERLASRVRQVVARTDVLDTAGGSMFVRSLYDADA